MSKESNSPNVDIVDKKYLDKTHIVTEKKGLDIREQHDYDAKHKEIREIIMEMERNYDLGKIVKEKEYIESSIDAKIFFLEMKLEKLRKERLNKNFKFKYIDLREWYDERINVMIGRLEGCIIALGSIE